MKFKFILKEKNNFLPQTIGVYCFTANPPSLKKATARQRNIFYIGKAKNLRERVKNHLQQPTFKDKFYINRTQKIGFISVDSEAEALILESRLIKKHRPKYNVLWKDDKNYIYVAITKPSSSTGKEELPRVFLTHQKLQDSSYKIQDYIGPFVDSKALKKTLSILRRIFPYRTSKTHPKTNCSWCHLKLCPGPSPNKKEYRRNIKNLSLFLQGKKELLIKALKKEMVIQSKAKSYEMAAKTRDQIIAMEKTISNAKIFNPDTISQTQNNWQKIDWLNTQNQLREILKIKNKISRIESYDISNIQGKMATGSMVVFINGKPDKSYYRKFKIKMQNEPNDTAMLKEILGRRFNHPEWTLPEIMLIDGGVGQLNAVIECKAQNIHFATKGASLKNIRIISLAKKNNLLHLENEKQPLLLDGLPQNISNLILYLRDEAHRFAITYHRKLRIKAIRG